MSFDVSAKLNGIDTSVLKQVSQEILKRANAQNTDFNVNSTFKTASQAIQKLCFNFYYLIIDANTANLIALNTPASQI